MYTQADPNTLPKPGHDAFPVLEITALSSDGQGLGRLSAGPWRGLVVFVPGALPGERVRIKIRKQTRSYLTAEIVEPIQRLAKASCPHADLCGGCALARLPYNRQLDWKLDFVRQAMLRTGKIPAERLEQVLAPILASPDIGCYRNKMEFAMACDSQGHILVGQRAFHSHALVATPLCERMPAIVQKICQKCAELCSETALPAFQPRPKPHGFWRFLVLRKGFLPASHQEAYWLLLLTSPGSKKERQSVRLVCEKLLAAFPEIACLVHEERKACDGLAIGDQRVLVLGQAADALLSLPLGQRWFCLDAASFFQINSQASQLLAQHVQSLLAPYAGKDTLLDLFCGVGAPGLLVADQFHKVFGIEIQARSAACAQNNAHAFNCTNYQARAGQCQQLMANLPQADILLCDPPRTGLEPETLKDLLRRAELQAICYISCNPATLARDLERLSGRFTVETIIPLDLFPHTPHVESIVRLIRK